MRKMLYLFPCGLEPVLAEVTHPQVVQGLDFLPADGLRYSDELDAGGVALHANSGGANACADIGKIAFYDGLRHDHATAFPMQFAQNE
jgi:hypothetical protein